uniref:Uncharacterized protein n=1 Tax=Arundo donax TaxID=35708 RepID=A0A0A9GW02_ARUDO
MRYLVQNIFEDPHLKTFSENFKWERLMVFQACWGALVACTGNEKIVLQHGKGNSLVLITELLLSCLKQSPLTTFGYGMPFLVSQDQTMTLMC